MLVIARAIGVVIIVAVARHRLLLGGLLLAHSSPLAFAPRGRVVVIVIVDIASSSLVRWSGRERVIFIIIHRCHRRRRGQGDGDTDIDIDVLPSLPLVLVAVASCR